MIMLLLTIAALVSANADRHDSADSPEKRALAYLAREVPRWSTENKCFSCHNNGDAARALYEAIRLGHAVPAPALLKTTQWLARPQEWDHNGGDTRNSDKALARIQFAGALVVALDAGEVKDRQILFRAAELVSEYQQKDGSWQADANGIIGSPATYGTALATQQACRILRRADAKQHHAAIARAERWLLRLEPRSNLDAAAILLATAEMKSEGTHAREQRCLARIRKGQAPKGGWGAYSRSAPEPFDTAVVLLALSMPNSRPNVTAMIGRGRKYLVSIQQADGSWQETTRPAGGESYAQRISTAAWASLALLSTH